jgi:hypothetical protein
MNGLLAARSDVRVAMKHAIDGLGALIEVERGPGGAMEASAASRASASGQSGPPAAWCRDTRSGARSGGAAARWRRHASSGARQRQVMVTWWLCPALVDVTITGVPLASVANCAAVIVTMWSWEAPAMIE